MKLSTCLNRKAIEFDVYSDVSDRGSIFAGVSRLDCVVACRTASSACRPDTARSFMLRTIICEVFRAVGSPQPEIHMSVY